MNHEQIENAIRELSEPFIVEQGFELVDIEYVKEGSQWFLRIYVDKDGGIEIDDCGKISEYLTKKLDEQDPIVGTYFLEVSSPGLERPLRKPKDFYKAIHHNVFLTTYEPIDGLKEFEGELVEYDEVVLSIQLTKQKLQIPVNKISSARLAVVF